MMKPKVKRFLVIFFGVFIPIACVGYFAYLFETGKTFDPSTLFAKGIQTLDNICIKADFNADGLVNGADLSALLGTWNAYDAKYDIWGKTSASDGVLDTFDLSRVVYCWMLTKPAECGDNRKDSTEECDPPGGNSNYCSSKYCGNDCKCAAAPTSPPTSTPAPTSITPPTSTPMPTVPPTLIPTVAVDNGNCQCHVTGNVCGKLGILQQCQDYDQTANMSACVKQSQCTAAACCVEAQKVANNYAASQGATISSFTCNAVPTFLNTCN